MNPLAIIAMLAAAPAAAEMTEMERELCEKGMAVVETYQTLAEEIMFLTMSGDFSPGDALSETLNELSINAQMRGSETILPFVEACHRAEMG